MGIRIRWNNYHEVQCMKETEEEILENYCGIYGYQNIKTGKIHYIGQTI